MIDEMVGLFLTGLSGFAARCGGRDLATRRAIDQAVADTIGDMPIVVLANLATLAVKI